MRGLAIRTARAVNRVACRSGRVWAERYHARALASPREVRGALVYILRNGRKHESAEVGPFDPCSSAPWFDGFRGGAPTPPVGVAPPVARPRTWLATVGWRRLGLIGPDEAPRAVMDQSRRGAGQLDGPRCGQGRSRHHRSAAQRQCARARNEARALRRKPRRQRGLAAFVRVVLGRAC
jgi:hypothetical protein